MNTIDKKKTVSKKGLKPQRQTKITAKQIFEKTYGKENHKLQEMQVSAAKNKMVAAEAFHAIASGCGLTIKQSRKFLNVCTKCVIKKGSDAYLGLLKTDGQSLKKTDSYSEDSAGKFKWLYDTGLGHNSDKRFTEVALVLKTEWATEVHAILSEATEAKSKSMKSIQLSFAKRAR